MKRNLNLFLGFCLLSIVSFSQIPQHKTEQIPVAKPLSKNAFEIPSSFAKNNVSLKEIDELIEKKDVKRIELYYTRFRESEDFDQQALNEKRVNELLKKYPQLNNEKIIWVWKEQTLATTKEDASKCFHGFRIYGVDKPIAKVETVHAKVEEPKVVQKESLYKNVAIKDKGNLPTIFTIDISKGGDFTAPSGSVVHVPANAVTDKFGKPIKGNYTIEYTEFRNQAEIAYSGLPMNFLKDGNEYVFNSAGMYTLYGKQNGKDLKLKVPITVDFNCTEQLTDLNFYQLDKTSKEWKEKRAINFNNNAQKVNQVPKQKNNHLFTELRSISWTVVNNHSVLIFDDGSWENYLKLKNENKEFIDKNVLEEEPKNKKVILNEVDPNTFINEVFIIGNRDIFLNLPVMSMSLLAENADKGHTYPNLVRGLLSPDFGVYNCDQAGRLGKQVQVAPIYVDKNKGIAINSPNVVCVIDRKLNCSLSFDPKLISVGLNSECEILMFTTDNKVYQLPKENFEALNLSAQKNGVILPFQMLDISDKVQSSDDLKAYLKL